jgi:hypothetical protein
MTFALERALTAAIEALDEAGFPYAIVGGLAAGAWGVKPLHARCRSLRGASGGSP